MHRRIAVIGGGPAGATCAERLAAGGLEVDLFEPSPEGEKPCGGGIPGAALREFPFLLDPDLPRRVVGEVHLLAPSGRSARLRLREGIHVFRRRQLDSYLRGRAVAAGASLRCEKVEGIRRAPVHGRVAWSVETVSGAHGPYDFLVGADGVRGIVRRTVAARTADENLSLARYAYVPGVPAEEMIIGFQSRSDGYLWVFPRTDHLSIGICATKPATTAARLEEELRRFMDAHYPEAAGSATTVKGYFIPADPSPPRPGPGEPWALIGDAGGFVDPITREGIAPAMRSGAELAERLLADAGSLAGGNFSRRYEAASSGDSSRRSYQGALSQANPPSTEPVPAPQLPENLRLSHAYRRGFFAEGFVERMIWMASGSKAISRVLADLFEGRQGYRGLKRRLLLNALPCGMQLGLGAIFGPRRAATQPPAARPDSSPRPAA